MDAGTISVVLEAVNNVSKEMDRVSRDVRAMTRDVEAAGTSAGRGMDNVGKSANNAGKQFSLAGKAMSAGMLMGGAAVAGAGVAVTGFVKSSVSSFRDFDQGMREVFTLIPGISGAAMDQMKSQVLSAADTMNRMPQEVIPALYQSLSAGVPPGNVFEFLETANQAAKGGVTDLTTAVDGLSSVINAYPAGMIDAAQASDLMFTAVRLGKTTFEEMSSSLANVTPLAAASGVAFEEVTAAIATITASGTPTAQAVTQIRAALVALNDPASEAAQFFREISGKTFAEFTAAGGTMTEALSMIREEADASGVNIQTLFGRLEGGMATLNLTGENAQKAADNLEAMKDSAGATEEAFETMDAGVGSALDDLSVKMEVLKIKTGESAAPAIIALVDVLNNDLGPALTETKGGIDVVKDGLGGIAEQLGLTGRVSESTSGHVGTMAKEYGLLVALGPAVAGFRGINALFGDSAEEAGKQVEVSTEAMEIHAQSVEGMTRYVEEAAVAEEEQAKASVKLAEQEEITAARIQATTDAQNAHMIMFGQVGEMALQQADALKQVAEAENSVASATSVVTGTLDGLAAAYSAAGAIQSTFSQQGSDYAGTASSMEKALTILQERQAEGIALTDEQIAFMGDAENEIQRMTSASEDAAIQEGMAARVKSELKAAQDAVNEARRTGVGDLEALEAQLSEAEGAAADLGIETYNEQGVMQDLNTTMGDLATVIGDLRQAMIDLGLIKAEPEVDLLGEELAKEGIQDIDKEIGMLPSSFTITANVDITEGLAQIDMLNNHLPHSPAKEGPLSKLPNWDALFEDLPEAAEDATDRLSEIFGRIAPIFRTATDALADGETYNRLVDNLNELFEWKRIAEEIGLGDEVVAAIQAEIEAKEAELAQVGAIIGVMVGDAFISTLSQAELDEMLDGWRQQIEDAALATQQEITSRLPSLEDLFTGDALGKAAQEMRDLMAMRDAMMEQGLDTTAIDEQMARLAEDILAMQQIMGSQAAQEWWANYQAALADEEARKKAEETMAAFTEEQLMVLAKHFESGETVTKEHVQKLLEAVEVGAISMEEAMALIAQVPQEELLPILAELEEKLSVDIVNAILAGDQAAEDAANGGLAILMQILELLGITMSDLAAATDTASDSFNNLGNSASGAASQVGSATNSISSGSGGGGSYSGGGGSYSGGGGSSQVGDQGLYTGQYSPATAPAVPTAPAGSTISIDASKSIMDYNGQGEFVGYDTTNNPGWDALTQAVGFGQVPNTRAYQLAHEGADIMKHPDYDKGLNLVGIVPRGTLEGNYTGMTVPDLYTGKDEPVVEIDGSWVIASGSNMGQKVVPWQQTNLNPYAKDGDPYNDDPRNPNNLVNPPYQPLLTDYFGNTVTRNWVARMGEKTGSYGIGLDDAPPLGVHSQIPGDIIRLKKAYGPEFEQDFKNSKWTGQGYKVQAVGPEMLDDDEALAEAQHNMGNAFAIARSTTAMGRQMTLYISADGATRPSPFGGFYLKGGSVDPFEMGGITTRPTLGYLSEYGQREAVIPLEGNGARMVARALVDEIRRDAGRSGQRMGGSPWAERHEGITENHIYIDGYQVARAIDDRLTRKYERAV